jgi:hypothetical protein
MKTEDQVCSLESAKRLKELGMKRESYFWWHEHPESSSFFVAEKNYMSEDGMSFNLDLPAFTVAELSELIPTWLELPEGTYAPLMSKRDDGMWHINVSSNHFKHERLTEMLALFVIFLLEKRHIKCGS